MDQSHEAEASQHAAVSLNRFEDPFCYEFKKTGESLVIKDMSQQIVFTVGSRDSRFRTKRELVGANDVKIATFEKKLLTLHDKWIAKNLNGEKVFDVHKTHMCKRGTSIRVTCAKDFSLDMAIANVGFGALAYERGSAAEIVGLGAFASEAGLDPNHIGPRATVEVVLGALAYESGLDSRGGLAAEIVDQFALASDAGRDAKVVGLGILDADLRLAKRQGLVVKGANPGSEPVLVSMPGVWEKREDTIRAKDSKEKMTDLRKFEFVGNLSSKEGVMYGRAGRSKIKVAEIHALDDQNVEGFLLEIVPNVNHQLMIFCVSVIEALESDAQKKNKLVDHIVDVTSKFVGGAVFGAGHFVFDCVANGCF